MTTTGVIAAPLNAARTYQPQTNGKVERLNRTLMNEWTYARPYLTEPTPRSEV